MPDEFKNLARTSFAGIEFPTDRYRLRGSARVHVHVYAHVPGGDIEKLGRNLYEAEVSGLFLTSATQYPDLWPARLELLRDLFEQSWTDYLVLPSLGRIKAMCTEWDQEFVAKTLNGERATFRFMEDQSSAFLLDKLISVNAQSVDASSAQLVTLSQALADANQLSPNEQSLFDTIQNTANQVLAIRDQADLAGLLLSEKIAMLTQLCAEADKTIRAIRDPENYPVLEALKELWAAAKSLGDAIAGPPTDFKFYTTPRRMTAADVSFAVYGTTTRAGDILQLNPINDAYDIPARTSIRYIPDETAVAA